MQYFGGKLSYYQSWLFGFVSHLCSKNEEDRVVVSSSWVHFVLIDNMIYLRWWWVTVLAGVLSLVVVV